MPLASEDRRPVQQQFDHIWNNLAPHLSRDSVNPQHFCHSAPRKPVQLSKSGQTQAHLPRCLVAFENKSGEKAGRTMLDCQRIWQPQIVLWNYIGVDQGHDDLLSMARRCVMSSIL
jgi:hypothetical protein